VSPENPNSDPLFEDVRRHAIRERGECVVWGLQKSRHG
jgi:hypothetical protein